jgi:hypothetical protein
LSTYRSKTIQDQLGHSSIVLTADTYTSVLPAAQYKAAEATTWLVLDAARNDRDKIAMWRGDSGWRHANVRRYRLSHRQQIRGHRRSPAVSHTPKAITGRGKH